ncbi:hypothetical protein RchiOBHm_Chr6g0264631 [Rosa chinensis]|uniref:Uncharacterized protein n=1 Tax=Rosa chinensis TaxID=74649 RepID=A0A2P6PP84_ROSCH|nr:hypothetical protein RchiOBHm_Chr6g0264631 [Rosa chinensis]
MLIGTILRASIPMYDCRLCRARPFGLPVSVYVTFNFLPNAFLIKTLYISTTLRFPLILVDSLVVTVSADTDSTCFSTDSSDSGQVFTSASSTDFFFLSDFPFFLEPMASYNLLIKQK